MNIFAPSWVELSVLVPQIGSLCVSRLRDPDAPYLWCLGFTGATLFCAILPALVFTLHLSSECAYVP